jgi:hypothetical protein
MDRAACPVPDMEDGRWRPLEEWLPAANLAHAEGGLAIPLIGMRVRPEPGGWTHTRDRRDRGMTGHSSVSPLPVFLPSWSAKPEGA